MCLEVTMVHVSICYMGLLFGWNLSRDVNVIFLFHLFSITLIPYTIPKYAYPMSIKRIVIFVVQGTQFYPEVKIQR